VLLALIGKDWLFAMLEGILRDEFSAVSSWYLATLCILLLANGTRSKVQAH